MPLTASKLRQNIYRVLDSILATGEPVEIERKGRRLKIVLAEGSGRLAGLPIRDYLTGEPDDIVEIDWSNEWRP
jgi:hypothetical protein